MEPRKPKPEVELQEQEFLKVRKLRYRKDDLIMKEGDYGLSIYRILSGRVRVYTETDGLETLLAILGPGEMLGEMIFLSSGFQRRSASARALEECELELLHPNALAREYEQMPAIVKLISDQGTGRLLRMNRLIAELTQRKCERERKMQEEEKRINRRASRRRKTRLPAICHPKNDLSPQASMGGEIRDISLGGVGVEIRPKVFSRFPYQPGDEFQMETCLPNNKKPLSFTARLVWSKRDVALGTFFLGVSFTHLMEGDRKELGFFFMTAT